MQGKREMRGLNKEMNTRGLQNEERETRELIKQREGTIGLSDKGGNLSVRSQLMWKGRADRQTKNGFMVCHLYWSRLTSSLWCGGERERHVGREKDNKESGREKRGREMGRERSEEKHTQMKGRGREREGAGVHG